MLGCALAEVRRSFGFPLAFWAQSDVGRVRSNNEDAWGSSWMPDGSLFVIVADGMGGHEAGEVASGLAVQVAEDLVTRDPDADPRQRLFDALIEANAVILDEGNRSGTRGMGTTAITAVLRGSEVYVAQVGDSRMYQVRRGHTVWRTNDHTRVQMLVDSGEIDEEEARNHPEAGMLTRALGHARMADGRPLEPEVLPEPLSLEEQDTLLLCSDGLTDLVEDWEIAQMIAGRTGEEITAALIELACERGGHDNITIAVIIAGSRAGAYDPNYQPPAWHTAAEHTDEAVAAEPTYEAPPMAAAPVAFAPPPAYAPPPAEPAAGGNRGMMIAVGLLLALLVIGGGLIIAVGAAWYFLA